ncbi:MAG: LysE family translocator [Steroidobacterales bacterium]
MFPASMSAHLVLKGLAIGFSIAAPVGPIGLLCIRRAVAEGARAGFVCGLGAATADAAYALIGGFAMIAVARWLVQEQRWFGLAGGLFLIYLGLRTLGAKPAHAAAAAGGRSALSAYGSTLLLTLANPMTMVSFAAVFAGIGAAGAATYAAATLVAGVFAGSALWWLLLSGLCGRARRRIGARAMQWLNRACALVLVGFGCYAIAGAVRAVV